MLFGIFNSILYKPYDSPSYSALMSFTHVSHNGTLISSGEALLPVFSLEFSYGFGVYETIRVKDKAPYFLAQHLGRLMHSASLLELEHNWTTQIITTHTQQLIEALGESTYNLKILLIGAQTAQEVQLYIAPLRPYYPNRKLYKDGATAITFEHERFMPGAKSLNMLPSYVAYREAKRTGAYDAILVNRRDELLEGTRTNLFALKDTQLITPPVDQVLAGVTRTHIIEVAKKNSYEVIEASIKKADIETFDSLCLSSTSTKLLPLRQIDDISLQISEPTHELVHHFARFLEQSKGISSL